MEHIQQYLFFLVVGIYFKALVVCETIRNSKSEAKKIFSKRKKKESYLKDAERYFWNFKISVGNNIASSMHVS